MSTQEEILAFMDGSLSADAEAELLHKMSVSPERRALLRGYFTQAAVIARDKASITVPFAAEQGLWARIDALLPHAMPVAAPIGTTASRFWTKLSTTSAAALGAVLLLVGLGTGYVIGDSSSVDGINIAADRTERTDGTFETALASTPIVSTPTTIIKERIVTKYIVKHVPVYMSMANASLAETIEQPAPEDISIEQPEPLLATISARESEHPSVGGEGLKPVFVREGNFIPEPKQKSILERFEFQFNESFGKQYPNTEATNTSLPLITNSAISTFFQVLPNSTKLWVGASVGTANVTRKTLMTQSDETQVRLTEEVRGEYVHVQTNWVGGFLQYRTPMFARAEMTFTAGFGLADAGDMTIGEIGMHYDATSDVGFTVGVRGTRLTYDLEAEKEELIRNRQGNLVTARGAMDATPSFNLELATGLFFHF